MPALHPTSTFNVEASLTQWLIDKFATITLPLTVNYSIVSIQPDTPLVTPSFSIVHRPMVRESLYEGHMAVDATNLMMISAWVSRTGNLNWLAQQRAMVSMIDALFASPMVIRLSDYLSAPASPTPVDYVVRTMGADYLNLPHDPNPDIERVSANIAYWWHLRTNVA